MSGGRGARMRVAHSGKAKLAAWADSFGLTALKNTLASTVNGPREVGLSPDLIENLDAGQR
jgi:hypothetical protein